MMKKTSYPINAILQKAINRFVEKEKKCKSCYGAFYQPQRPAMILEKK